MGQSGDGGRRASPRAPGGWMENGKIGVLVVKVEMWLKKGTGRENRHVRKKL